MSEDGQLSAQEIRDLYSMETGKLWDDDVGMIWCNQNHERFEDFTYRKVLKKHTYLNLSEKAGILSQTPCLICGSIPPIVNFPLRIKPESWQALSSHRKKSFIKAISHRFAEQTTFEKFLGEVCVSIIFICSIKRRKRDVDNVAKLILDSLKEVVMGDDKDVAHLSIARIEHSGDEEYILVRIARSGLNSVENVVAPYLNHGWAGMEELSIDGF